MTAFLPFLTFSEVFSTGSVDLSTEVEACDLLSHVDSEDVFGIEETSSSLVTVEEDEAPRSGDDTLEVSTEWETLLAGFEDDLCGRDSRDAGWSGNDSVSVSSAQLLTEAIDPGVGAELTSLAGVAAPDADLLVVAGVAMPFAACAYEKVEAIVDVVCDSVWIPTKKVRASARYPWWERCYELANTGAGADVSGEVSSNLPARNALCCYQGLRWRLASLCGKSSAECRAQETEKRILREAESSGGDSRGNDEK